MTGHGGSGIPPEGAAVAVVLPAWNEAGAIGEAIRGIPEGLARAVIVVDGGSSDGTVRIARDAGAEVITEPRRGYGLACLAGAVRARQIGAEVVAWLDAGGCADPSDLAAVVAPVVGGGADLVVGSRTRGRRERGSLRPAQILGNALASAVVSLRSGTRCTDLGPIRAIRLDALAGLGLDEIGSGWPVQMQIRAGRSGLRVCEVPVAWRRRRAGRSKVSGSLVGSLRAAGAILKVLAREGWR